MVVKLPVPVLLLCKVIELIEDYYV